MGTCKSELIYHEEGKGTWGKADADLAKVRGETYEIGKEYADHTRKVGTSNKGICQRVVSRTKPPEKSIKRDTEMIGSSN